MRPIQVAVNDRAIFESAATGTSLVPPSPHGAAEDGIRKNVGSPKP
jgi:hypothetical protein